MKPGDSITHTTYDNDNKIVSMCVTKIVKPTGSGAMVILPRQLIGKKVEVRYVRE